LPLLGTTVRLVSRLTAVTTLLICCSTSCLGADAEIQSVRADSDPALDTNASSSFWRGALPVYMDADTMGRPDIKFRTEVRTRWTERYLYFLFICPYEQLDLKPNPNTSAETYGLWNWDVAEVFIGSDFDHIRRYKEFEMSPRGEWIDLDIDLDQPKHEDGWKWNSGFSLSARIDEATHIWYGAMKIPYTAIDDGTAAVGNRFRINLFRSQGPPSARHQIAWQAPMKDSFHVPEKFGILRLVEIKEIKKAP
jgi:Carbohydrate family 9 binding domain-like